MSYSRIEAHERLEYTNSVTMVAQQTRDPFAGAVTDVMARGEAQSATDLYDAGEYAYGEDRSNRNPEMPVTGDKRWLVRPPVIESGQHIDIEDKFDTARDPTSTYVSIHTKRVVRGKADRTLGIRRGDDGLFRVADGGILGSSVSGKRPGGAAVALPGAQFVPVGATGLTVAKLRDALLELRKNEFGMEDDDALYCPISAMQIDDLLAIAEASSTPLNAFNIEQLRAGKPTMLMGITWIKTNRLPYKDGTTNTRLCPIFSKANISRGIWQDVKGDMWNDSSAKNKPYAYVSAYIDAVRLQDKGVVVIECLEA